LFCGEFRPATTAGKGGGRYYLASAQGSKFMLRILNVEPGTLGKSNGHPFFVGSAGGLELGSGGLHLLLAGD